MLLITGRIKQGEKTGPGFCNLVHLRVETCDAVGSQNACRVRVVVEIDITVFNASVH